MKKKLKFWITYHQQAMLESEVFPSRPTIITSTFAVALSLALLGLPSEGFLSYPSVIGVRNKCYNQAVCRSTSLFPSSVVLRSASSSTSSVDPDADDDVASKPTATSTRVEEDENILSITTIAPEGEATKKKRWFVGENVCLYKRSDGLWKRRKDISELRIGERLFATKLDQDLLGGKTGAKVYFDCGVGRYDNSTKRWQMVNGMMRVGGRETKKAVVQKRLKRMLNNNSSNNRSSTLVQVYVSRINLQEKRFEVLPSYEEAISYEHKTAPRRISVSSLLPGQELVGKILRVEPYGAIIDVGANKHGLLHIHTVANLTGTKDVFKPNGLKEVGIIRKAEVRVSVLSNGFKQYRTKTDNTQQKWARQLELDFTKDVKEEAEREQREAKEKLIEERRAKWEANNRQRGGNNNNNTATVIEDSSTTTATSDESADDDEEDYDEDRAIEEALGLDYY